MECHMAGVMRCCLDKNCSWFSPNIDMENIHRRRFKVGLCNTRRDYQKRTLLSNGKYPTRQAFALPISLEHKSSSSSAQEYSSDGDEATSDDVLSQKLARDELKSLLADSQRSKLVNKLSEANQQNRFLKRQLHNSEEALVSFKTELADLELEIKALATLAEEVAKSGIPQDSRKINGKYIQSHLLSRLEAVHVKLKEQVKDVDVVQSKEVPLYWVGMAESVKVMGSFDEWTEGKQLSPEYTGSFSKFSATLMLRPGRYEIKFLVDGEWHLTPELPIVGEGMTINNLLIVE